MKHGLELAYIVLGSRDRAALNTYLGNTIGLVSAAADTADVSHATSSSRWRVDERAWRIEVQDSAKDDALCLGFEAADAATYERILAQLQAQGAAVQAGTATELAERQVQRIASTTAPWGVRIELVMGLARAAQAFASPLQPKGFVTEGRGFGHAVFTVGDQATYDATCKFVSEGLGLSLSDWLEASAGPLPLHVSFYHCNPRHHSLAFAHIPIGAVPQSLHHINLQVADMDAVGITYDRCVQAAAPMANTLGRHGNDKMFSFYNHTPGGWQIEVGSGGVEITEDWSQVIKWERISDWGHQPPAMLPAAAPMGAPA